MKMRRLGASGLKVSEVGLGCNNFGMRIDQKATQAVVDAAIEAGVTLFVSAQNQYSLLERKVEFEVLPACEHFGLGFLPFFPLASGLLSGKYRRGEKPPEGTRLAAWGARGAAAMSDRNFDKVEKLEAWAA